MNDSRYLEFNSPASAGGKIAEQLPDIQGAIGYLGANTQVDVRSSGATGAFRWEGFGNGRVPTGGTTSTFDITFYASRFNSIYNGTKVKPKALSVVPIIKY